MATTAGNKGRGFASLSPDERRAIASKGGKAAHESGNGRRFDSVSAKIAGAKGGATPRKPKAPAEAGP